MRNLDPRYKASVHFIKLVYLKLQEHGQFQPAKPVGFPKEIYINLSKRFLPLNHPVFHSIDLQGSQKWHFSLPKRHVVPGRCPLGRLVEPQIHRAARRGARPGGDRRQQGRGEEAEPGRHPGATRTVVRAVLRAVLRPFFGLRGKKMDRCCNVLERLFDEIQVNRGL